MKAVLTVIGKDSVGIMAKVSASCALKDLLQTPSIELMSQRAMFSDISFS